MDPLWRLRLGHSSVQYIAGYGMILTRYDRATGTPPPPLLHRRRRRAPLRSSGAEARHYAAPAESADPATRGRARNSAVRADEPARPAHAGGQNAARGR